MTTRLYLARHGQVAARHRGRFYGRLDVPLSERGREEAEVVARLVPTEGPLAPSVVVCSPLSRARYGAERIGERIGLEPVSDPSLIEIDRGDWADRSREEIEARTPGALDAWFQTPSTQRPPRGESVGDVAARVGPALDRWAARADRGAVAIVAHLWVLRVAACLALDLDLDRSPRLDIGTGRLLVLDWPRGGITAAYGRGGGVVRPTLASLGAPAAPEGRGWFRGPHRSPR